MNLMRSEISGKQVLLVVSQVSLVKYNVKDDGQRRELRF